MGFLCNLLLFPEVSSYFSNYSRLSGASSQALERSQIVVAFVSTIDGRLSAAGREQQIPTIDWRRVK